MPWKESRAVDQRLRFLAEYQTKETTLIDLCRQFGISRPTAYKWIKRYEELGPEGLLELADARKVQLESSKWQDKRNWECIRSTMLGRRCMKRLYVSALTLFAIAGPLSNAQILRVRVVNGRSGKPIRNAYVNVWVGDQRKDAVPVPLDSGGNGFLRLKPSEADAALQSESAHSATFIYAPEIRLEVGLALCETTQQKNTWFQITKYSTDEWTRTGIVTANHCGKAAAKPEPGVLIIFARPLTFWESLSE